MPSIKPVSALRDYNKVLSSVSYDNPVFLTKNGQGKYAVIEIDEYDRTNATLKLLTKLEDGMQSARAHGWVPAEDVYAKLGISA